MNKNESAYVKEKEKNVFIDFTHVFHYNKRE